MVNPGFVFEGVVAIPGGDSAQKTTLRKPVSAKGIGLSIDRSSYYEEVNISALYPFITGNLSYLIGLCRHLQRPEIHQRHLARADKGEAFCTSPIWNFEFDVGFKVAGFFGRNSAHTGKVRPESSPHWRLPSLGNRHILKGKVLQVRW